MRGETTFGNLGEDRQNVPPARVFILLHCPHLLVVEKISRRQALAYFEANLGVLVVLTPSQSTSPRHKQDVEGWGNARRWTRRKGMMGGTRGGCMGVGPRPAPLHAAKAYSSRTWRIASLRPSTPRLPLPSSLAGAVQGRSRPTLGGLRSISARGGALAWVPAGRTGRSLRLVLQSSFVRLRWVLRK